MHPINYPGFNPADGFKHDGLIARPVSTPPPVTQVVPEDPAVTQAVCVDDALTVPSVVAATTANVSYQVNGTVAPGETVTVVATLAGDNVEWGTLPTGWSAGANNTAVFTVELDAPTCELPVDEPPLELDLPPFPATQPPLPPVQEQLPPPGTPETPQPETPVAPQPETPGVEAAPPPGAPQAPSSLPVTGTATWIMAALATALVGAGVGMRRIGRES